MLRLDASNAEGGGGGNNLGVECFGGGCGERVGSGCEKPEKCPDDDVIDESELAE